MTTSEAPTVKPGKHINQAETVLTFTLPDGTVERQEVCYTTTMNFVGIWETTTAPDGQVTVHGFTTMARAFEVDCYKWSLRLRFEKWHKDLPVLGA